MSDDLSFNHEDLWYTKTAGPDTKVPPKGWEWGGYSQSFVAAETVYTHEQIRESDHDHWAVVGTQDFDHGTLSTLIFDLDVHKAPDDFDVDDIDVPGDTTIVKSQSGGFHVYFQVHADRGELKESDFQMTKDLGWDIDIRGSAVSMHVVAPTQVPGNETAYDIVNDDSVKAVLDPADAADRIRYQGEPLLEYSPDRAPGGNYSINRDVEPPEDMPLCYHRGLQLRKESPDEHSNPHKVNVLTALCGLAAGYEVETMVEHFCDEYPPEDPDEEQTKYHLNHIADKIDRDEYSPPSISTLRDFGILDESEYCDCRIEYHGDSKPELFIDWDEVKRGEAILKAQTSPTDPAGELEHRGGHYGYEWIRTDDEGNVVDSGFDIVANFTLETLSILDTFEGTILKLRVDPNHPMEESYEVTVPPKVFNEARTFREEIVRGRTTYFDSSGTSRSTQQVLNDLRRTVGSQNAPQRTGTEFIGLHGDGYDQWVTPNGTLTADGWDNDAEHVFYEKSGDNDDELESSSLGEKFELGPDQDEYDADAIAEIMELLPWTRNPERGLPVLGWFYSAPLKPLIHDDRGEFNLLQVAGGTGTGKTSTLEMYYQLFGAAPSPFGCDNTPFTIEKRVSSSCGFPVWLDEYKPTDMSEYKRKQLHNLFRDLSRGASSSKGRPSLGEVIFHYRAPVVFSGEQTVSKPAVRRRTILTQFSSSSTSDDYERIYSQLVGSSYTDDNGEIQHPDGYDLQNHALAYYEYILGKSPEHFMETWQEAGQKREKIQTRLGAGALDPSEEQGLQTIVFGYLVYRDFAEWIGAETDELPGESHLHDALEHVIQNIGPDGRRREHIDDFTELVARAAVNDYLEEGVDYKLVDSRKYETDALAFYMPTTFDKVRKYMRDYGIENEYSILGKNDYLDNYADKAEESGSYPLETNHKVRGLDAGSKAVLIDAERAEELLDSDFTTNAFTEGPESEADDNRDKEETDTNICDLEVGWQTIVATVASKLEPKPWLQAEGTLEDGTGLINFEARGQSDPLADIDQGDTVEITNAYVTEGEAGDLIIEFRDGATQIQTVGGSQSGLDTDPGDGKAAADGGSLQTEDASTDAGPPADAEGARADAQRVAQRFRAEGIETDEAGVTPAAAAGKMDNMDPEDVKDALEHGARKMQPALFLQDREEGVYWLLDG